MGAHRQRGAVELGCDWHTINDTVAYGTALIDDDPNRIGTVTALGLDETLFTHEGRWRRQLWSASIVDVRAGRLLDIVPGRNAWALTGVAKTAMSPRMRTPILEDMLSPLTGKGGCIGAA
jgi:hypothetical protein